MTWPLEQRPGFLIRRLHQIHVSIFMRTCEGFGITPLQYTVMSALADSGPCDQSTLATLVFLDRTTTTGIIKRLRARGLIDRKVSEEDRRAQICSLTKQGLTLFQTMESDVRDAHDETVAPLNLREQATLVRLMSRIVESRQGTDDRTIPTY